MNHRKRITLASLAAVSALLLSGCSGATPTEGPSAGGSAAPAKVTLQLQWLAQAQFAG